SSTAFTIYVHGSIRGGCVTCRNNIAGTAFGLLPLLGAGHTHKAGAPKYKKPVKDGLEYLIGQLKAHKMTGDFGNGMYAQGLATIALCEAYAMSQDKGLKPYAQLAVDYIVRAQQAEGGGR